MEYTKEILRYDEQIIFQLRALYEKFGYSQYRMSRFEEYELYAGNKAFMPSGDILTFTGVSGRLMALRPDVTLSIVKYSKDDGNLKKLYYNENVYRSDGNEFKEQMQAGLECIGSIDVDLMGEVLILAKKSLETISKHSRLCVSHMGFLSGLLQSEHLSTVQRNEIINCISEKNVSGLKNLCDEYECSKDFSEKITTLAKIYGSFSDVSNELHNLCLNKEMSDALEEMETLHKVVTGFGVEQDIFIDFSVANDITYYNGIIFQGFVEGIPTRILSGGRYDELMRKFGKNFGAIGFAVYLDTIGTQGDGSTVFQREHSRTVPLCSIALPKGRLGEKAYAIFEAAGYGCPEIKEESRKLVFENAETGVRYFWVKPSDVAIYVERGAADIGVVGKDILLEHSPDVYELLDLGIGKCNVSVAAETDFAPTNLNTTLRVATKFPNIARRHYQAQGREIDVIELNGSIELAPILGLSDVIVDIVETGQTLLENNMKPTEMIVEVSARLISNKASYTFNHNAIESLCNSISRGINKISSGS